MRGILMTEPSVLGLIRGSKSQTRRLAKDRAKPLYKVGETLYVKETWQAWRQTNVEYDEWEPETDVERLRGSRIELRATSDSTGPWVSSLFMPAWAARLHITITEVRRQNLLDITEADAHAEGIDEYHGLLDGAAVCAMARLIGGMSTDARTWYLTAWQGMHWLDGRKAKLKTTDPKYYASLVASNPVVDAYTFTVIKL